MNYIEGLLKATGSWIRIIEFDSTAQEMDWMGFLERWQSTGQSTEYMDGVLIDLTAFAAFRGGDA